MHNTIENKSVFTATLRNLARNLSSTGRSRKQVVSIVIDTMLVVFSLWAAFSLRTGEPFTDLLHAFHLFLVLPPLCVLVFASLGVYRWIIRSSNIRLYIQLVKGTALSGLVLLVLMHLFPSAGVNPRSLFVIFALVLMTGTCVLRMIWCGLFDVGKNGMPIAVYGAGSAGSQLVSSLLTGSQFQPVCFIDDNPDLRGSTIQGLPVFAGGSHSLASQLSQLDVAEVVVAIPSLDAIGISMVVSHVESLGIPFKTLPSVTELISGQAKINEIREISIKDILGRNEVTPDPTLLGRCVEGKKILVAGGGGSIGSELCRQIIKLGPSSLTVLDSCEANLYYVTEEITSLLSNMMDLPPIEFNPVLCSITDSNRVHRLFDEFEFDTVYHAAAYKHVPIVESHPEQGVEVNVFGTLNLVDAAIRSKVRSFVLISTDKAVRPANVMGETKRVAELILQAKARDQNDTVISMVRFGNVLDSTGSVVPKFRKQIEAGGPITLTDSKITRYFMTIPEASQLVLQASAIANGGDVFVLDMGEPVSILHLAETMITLHRRQIELMGGRAPDIAIEITGLRPGEKMYEELFIGDDCIETLVTKVMSADEQFLEWSILSSLLNELNLSLSTYSRPKIRQVLSSIVNHADQHQLPMHTSRAIVENAAPRMTVVS